MPTAIRKLVRGANGRLQVIYKDTATGETVPNIAGYQLLSVDGTPFANPQTPTSKPIDPANPTAPAEGQAEMSPGGDNISDYGARKADTISSGMFGQKSSNNTEAVSKSSSTGTGRGTTSSSSADYAARSDRSQGLTGTNMGDLPDRQMARMDTNLSGAGRSEVPSSGIREKVQDAVTDTFGPGYHAELFSGEEPAGHDAVGSNRHTQGFAGDFRVYDDTGRQLTVKDDPAAFQDLSQNLAAQYGANIGFGKEYMGGVAAHFDTMPPEQFSANQGPQWASGAKAMEDRLNEARATGLMAPSYYDAAVANGAPTPTPSPGYNPQESLTSRVAFSADEKDLMSRTLAGEIDQRHTDLTTQAGRMEAMGILSTIENRALSKYGTVEAAVTAPNQYSTWNTPAAADTANKNYSKSPDVFNSLVDDYFSDPKNNLGFTNYYNPSLVTPEFGKTMTNAVELGPHRFGSLPEFEMSMQTNKTNTTTPDPTSTSTSTNVERQGFSADPSSSNRGTYGYEDKQSNGYQGSSSTSSFAGQERSSTSNSYGYDDKQSNGYEGGGGASTNSTGGGFSSNPSQGDTDKGSRDAASSSNTSSSSGNRSQGDTDKDSRDNASSNSSSQSAGAASRSDGWS